MFKISKPTIPLPILVLLILLSLCLSATGLLAGMRLFIGEEEIRRWQTGVPQNQITFTPSNSVLYIEVARTPEQLQQGLMYRTRMDVDAGMLFIFNNSSLQTFWMKNTLIPLDIIFVDENFRIVKIHSNTRPNQTTETYPSLVPVKYVVETNGGWAQRRNVKEGDTISVSII